MHPGSNFQETIFLGKTVKASVVEDDKAELTLVLRCDGKEGNTLDTYYDNLSVGIYEGEEVNLLVTVKE